MPAVSKDEAIVQDAYGTAVKNLFAKTLEEYWRVQSDADRKAKESAADKKFLDGLAVIRRARDQAVKMLGK